MFIYDTKESILIAIYLHQTTMPKNKSYSDRKKILNELFRTKGYSLTEIIERINERLDITISKKTIQNDIQALRKEALEKGAEIPCIDGRYRYEPKNFNIFEVKIDPSSVARIKLAAALLKQIPGLDIHEELNEIFEKLEMRGIKAEEDEQQFIQFDTRPEYTGAKYLAEILEAIKGETVISFDYQPFNQYTPIRIIIHPYLLKEWNNRWFLIGLPQHFHEQGVYEFHQYGLERIKGKIKAEKIEFYRHYKFDAASFYKNVIGITIPKDAKEERVVLQFTAPRAKYIETNPLHHSQKLIQETNTHKKFEYHLILNKELESIVLSYGADVQIIEPSVLREQITKIVLAMNKY